MKKFKFEVTLDGENSYCASNDIRELLNHIATHGSHIPQSILSYQFSEWYDGILHKEVNDDAGND